MNILKYIKKTQVQSKCINNKKENFTDEFDDKFIST